MYVCGACTVTSEQFHQLPRRTGRRQRVTRWHDRTETVPPVLANFDPPPQVPLSLTLVEERIAAHRAGVPDINHGAGHGLSISVGHEAVHDQGVTYFAPIIKAGLALNPATTLDFLTHLWDKIDLVLMMSVNPGFGGQVFIRSVLDKIKKTRLMIDASKKNIDLAVDGGVKKDNIAEIARAGANMFIAGSAIYNEKDYAKTISAMRKELSGI